MALTIKDITIQIMNVYECNGTNIFMRWKMKCSIQRGEAEMNGTFHLSPNESIFSISQMRKHSLLCFIKLVQRFKFLNKFKRKVFEKPLWLKQNSLQAVRPTLCRKYYADACVMLNARTAPVAFAPSRVLHVLILIGLVLRANVRRLYWKYCRHTLMLCERWVQ